MKRRDIKIVEVVKFIIAENEPAMRSRVEHML